MALSKQDSLTSESLLIWLQIMMAHKSWDLQRPTLQYNARINAKKDTTPKKLICGRWEC
jgi:hypothetical protein